MKREMGAQVDSEAGNTVWQQIKRIALGTSSYQGMVIYRLDNNSKLVWLCVLSRKSGNSKAFAFLFVVRYPAKWTLTQQVYF